MNETPDLFGSCIRQALSDPPLIQSGSSIVPRARRNNPHTSAQAALSAIGLASKHQAVILACLKAHNELTGHEIAERIGLTYQQVSKRTAELNDQHKIQRVVVGRDEDDKAIFWTRPSPAGRPCCVWQVQQNAGS